MDQALVHDNNAHCVQNRYVGGIPAAPFPALQPQVHLAQHQCALRLRRGQHYQENQQVHRILLSQSGALHPFAHQERIRALGTDRSHHILPVACADTLHHIRRSVF